MATDFAPITPAMLQWARETSGYSLEEVAKKAGVKPGTIAAWEDGSKPITQGRVDLLANIYKRPTAIFYLPEAPAEDDARKVADFRAGTHHKPPALLYQLRHARERRAAAVALASEAAVTPARFSFSCNANENALEVGERLREWLNVDHQQQQAWVKKDPSGYTALNAWKEAIESRSVLVFQAGKRDLGQCRGFSINADVYPVIVTRSVDTPVSRCFTLMHELAHLGLRQGGVCDLLDHGVESFCNKVAAAALMPAATFAPLLREFKRHGTSEPSIVKLARAYSVSEQALVLRMLELGLVDSSLYARMRDHFEMRNAQASARKDEEKTSAPIPQHTRAIARNGRAFTKLVLDAYHRNAISAQRASRYLEVSYQFLGDIERDMARHAFRVAS